MASRFVLDTHALVWYLEGSARLSSDAKAVMDDPASEMILSVIALAEALHIVDKGRTSIPSSADSVACGSHRVEGHVFTESRRPQNYLLRVGRQSVFRTSSFPSPVQTTTNAQGGDGS